MDSAVKESGLVPGIPDKTSKDVLPDVSPAVADKRRSKKSRNKSINPSRLAESFKSFPNGTSISLSTVKTYLILQHSEQSNANKNYIVRMWKKSNALRDEVKRIFSEQHNDFSAMGWSLKNNACVDSTGTETLKANALNDVPSRRHAKKRTSKRIAIRNISSLIDRTGTGRTSKSKAIENISSAIGNAKKKTSRNVTLKSAGRAFGKNKLRSISSAITNGRKKGTIQSDLPKSSSQILGKTNKTQSVKVFSRKAGSSHHFASLRKREASFTQLSEKNNSLSGDEYLRRYLGLVRKRKESNP